MGELVSGAFPIPAGPDVDARIGALAAYRAGRLQEGRAERVEPAADPIHLDSWRPLAGRKPGRELGRGRFLQAQHWQPLPPQNKHISMIPAFAPAATAHEVRPGRGPRA